MSAVQKTLREREGMDSFVLMTTFGQVFGAHGDAARAVNIVPCSRGLRVTSPLFTSDDHR